MKEFCLLVCLFLRQERNLQSTSGACSNKYSGRIIFYNNGVWFFFPLHFTLSLFPGQRGRFVFMLQTPKQMLLVKTTIVFLKLQPLKILCFSVVLEGKGKKEKGRQGRKGVKSVDLVTSRPSLSLTPGKGQEQSGCTGCTQKW